MAAAAAPPLFVFALTQALENPDPVFSITRQMKE